MNEAVGAKTNWGKSYAAQYLAEQNIDEFEGLVILDYKDEFTGLVEEYDDVRRLTIPSGAQNISPEKWAEKVDENPKVQLARTTATTEEFREVAGNVAEALSLWEKTAFVVIDEAHKVAPQSQAPDPLVTLATTWHGDGYGVLWITQRWAEIETTIVAECEASMLGGFRDPNDLGRIEAVEYPPEVHQSISTRVDRAVPEELLVDGEPLTLRRFEDDEGHTIGSEWVYADDTTLRRVDSREWELQSTHYGSDRKRINQPFDDG
ncbi:ATP-binding protein [Halapricum desulfuricans]|uniref:HerA helicase n=1 Tax=Halapricum desulfuricans TaxID=2841257 RepID=A0A897N0J9_9EURY|nr:ATP-binding protein [Halapricum desulfuricans]QSG06462.1 HerA helicase [Halapricum desulfuricans]